MRGARDAVGPLLLIAVLTLTACGGSRDEGFGDRPATASGPLPSKKLRINLDASPAEVAARSSIPILSYHQLRPPTNADAAIDRPYIMSPARLRSQLDVLQRRGYTTISPDQLLAHLTTGAELPPKPVILSFDDAVDDHYRIALPELRKRKMTAMFFVMTVVLGNPGYMTRGQVRRLDRAGMTIAAHTWDHNRVDEYAGEDWRVQIDEPTETLERIVGHEIRYFAYPFGVWSPAAFPRLRKAGIHAAFQLVEKPIKFRDPLMTIRRKIADPNWSSAEFEKALRSGFRKVGA